jgi:hypothetical protein
MTETYREDCATINNIDAIIPINIINLSLFLLKLRKLYEHEKTEITANAIGNNSNNEEELIII